MADIDALVGFLGLLALLFHRIWREQQMKDDLHGPSEDVSMQTTNPSENPFTTEVKPSSRDRTDKRLHS